MWVRSIKVLVDTLEIKKTEEEIELFARNSLPKPLLERDDSDSEYIYELLAINETDDFRYELDFVC
jgi:hypothetical protein